MRQPTFSYNIPASNAGHVIEVFIDESYGIFLTSDFPPASQFTNSKSWNTENYNKIRQNLDGSQKPICDFLRFINGLSPLDDKLITTIFTDLKIPMPNAADYKIIFKSPTPILTISHTDNCVR